MNKIRANNFEELCKNIDELDINERCDLLYGVLEFSNEPHKYDICSILYIQKEKEDKYEFVSNIFFAGHELIDYICKQIGYSKWYWFTGFRKLFTKKEITCIINYINTYSSLGSQELFKRAECIGKNKIVKYASPYYKDALDKRDKLARPYIINRLKEEIELTEKLIADLDNKREILRRLQKEESGVEDG